ncbi:MAG: type II secretion system protein GspD, partial [Proteobacteria bacterium]|nr:type II secretion system protein GspD [Pseudomonadota bacterium]
KNVPYQTRSSADAGTETYSSYEYKDVGTTLKITPQISKDRLVRLNVYQELTRLDSATQPLSADRPTTLKRQIETTIIVEDASSVVIGGLIDESISKSEKKVPCLGSIPVLGYAFKAISDGSDRTNLYVFLTPRVIKNPLEGQKLYDQKRSEIEAIKRGEVILYDQDKNKENQTVKPQ